MDPDSGAGLLHRLTSYTPDRAWDEPVDDPRVRHDLAPSDPATRPPQLKEYRAALPTVALPRELPSAGPAAVDVLAGRVPDAGSPDEPSLDIAALGRLLFLAAGVVRTGERPYGTHLFRAAGSAGARFPLEVYVSARGVDGLPDGVHWYDALGHALVQVGPAPADGATTFVVTGVPWRTGWRYAERGWRHLYWDGGTLVSQLEAAAAAAGLAPRVRTVFPDAAVRALVGADGVHEYPIALVTLGDGAPALAASGDAVRGVLPEVELPLATQAQAAGERDALGPAWPVGAVVDLPVPAAAQGVRAGGTLDEVVLRRGSQRLLDPGGRLPREDVEWAMAVALRGIDVPHVVAAHAVDGLEPGVHPWPPARSAPGPLRPGDVRDDLYELALRQGLASDAAYVAVSYADPATLDDRSYRTAQLAAGVVEGRLHLAAYALGAGASGMTFYDSMLADVLGLPEDAVGLLVTCVGVPEYVSRPGGGPGAPVSVRNVEPRFGDL